eukprot:SAG22_NODE_1536_length_4200_cov_1.740551_2_plen_527_part_00
MAAVSPVYRTPRGGGGSPLAADPADELAAKLVVARVDDRLGRLEQQYNELKTAWQSHPAANGGLLEEFALLRETTHAKVEEAKQAEASTRAQMAALEQASVDRLSAVEFRLRSSVSELERALTQTSDQLSANVNAVATAHDQRLADEHRQFLQAVDGLHEALATREEAGRARLEKVYQQLDGQIRADATLAADRLQAAAADLGAQNRQTAAGAQEALADEIDAVRLELANVGRTAEAASSATAAATTQAVGSIRHELQAVEREQAGLTAALQSRLETRCEALQSTLGWESSRLATEITNNHEAALAAVAKAADGSAAEREKLQQLLRLRTDKLRSAIIEMATEHHGALAKAKAESERALAKASAELAGKVEIEAHRAAESLSSTNRGLADLTSSVEQGLLTEAEQRAEQLATQGATLESRAATIEREQAATSAELQSRLATAVEPKLAETATAAEKANQQLESLNMAKQDAAMKLADVESAVVQLAEQLGTSFDGDEHTEQLEELSEAISALEVDHQLMLITNANR